MTRARILSGAIGALMILMLLVIFFPGAFAQQQARPGACGVNPSLEEGILLTLCADGPSGGMYSGALKGRYVKEITSAGVVTQQDANNEEQTVYLTSSGHPSSGVKGFAATGGPAIALGDTDFADDVEDAVDIERTTWDPASRTLTLTSTDGTTKTVDAGLNEAQVDGRVTRQVGPLRIGLNARLADLEETEQDIRKDAILANAVSIAYTSPNTWIQVPGPIAVPNARDARYIEVLLTATGIDPAQTQIRISAFAVAGINGIEFTNAGGPQHDNNRYWLRDTGGNFQFKSDTADSYTITITDSELDVTDHLKDCPDGQILKQISGDWDCAADATGGGGGVQATSITTLYPRTANPSTSQAQDSISDVNGNLVEMVEGGDAPNVVHCTSDDYSTYAGRVAPYVGCIADEVTIEWDPQAGGNRPAWKFTMPSSVTAESVYAIVRTGQGQTTYVLATKQGNTQDYQSGDDEVRSDELVGPVTAQFWSDRWNGTPLVVHGTTNRPQDWWLRQHLAKGTKLPRVATDDEAQAGTETGLRSWSPHLVSEAIDALAAPARPTCVDELPVPPFTVGQMFCLVATGHVQNPVQQTFATGSGGARLTTLTGLTGWATLAQYTAGYAGSGAPTLRGKTFLVGSVEPTGSRIVRIWWRAAGDTGDYTSGAVSETGASGTFQHYFEVTGGLAYNAFSDGDKISVYLEREDGTYLPLSTDYERGDWTADTTTTLTHTPGTAAYWAETGNTDRIPRGKLPREGFQPLISGPGVGVTVVSSNTDSFLQNPTGFTPPYDLDDALNGAAIIEIVGTYTLGNRSVNTIGFNAGATADDADLTHDFSGLVAASAIADAATYDGSTNRGVKVTGTATNVHNGSSTLGEVALYLAHDSGNLMGYVVGYDATGGALRFVVSLDVTIIVEHSDIGPAATTFVELSDTPDDYTGEGGKYVALNSGATALEFVDAPAGGGSGAPSGNLTIALSGAFTPAGGSTTATADRVVTNTEWDDNGGIMFSGGFTNTANSRTNPYIVTLPQADDNEGTSRIVYNGSTAFIRVMTAARLALASPNGRRQYNGSDSFFLEPTSGGVISIVGPNKVAFIPDAHTSRELLVYGREILVLGSGDRDSSGNISLTRSQAIRYGTIFLTWGGWTSGNQIRFPISGTWNLVNWANNSDITWRGVQNARRTAITRGGGTKSFVNVTVDGDVDLMIPDIRLRTVTIPAIAGAVTTQTVSFTRVGSSEASPFGGTVNPVVVTTPSVAGGGIVSARTNTGFTVNRLAQSYTLHYIAMRP